MRRRPVCRLGDSEQKPVGGGDRELLAEIRTHQVERVETARLPGGNERRGNRTERTEGRVPESLLPGDGERLDGEPRLVDDSHRVRDEQKQPVREGIPHGDADARRDYADDHRLDELLCGGHLLARHPQWDLVDVFAATIPSFPFEPGIHVNYESTVLPMHDGLTKMKDFPAELGGSGETLPE